MPSYAYRCTVCDEDLTVTHPMAGPAAEECSCGGRLSRVYSAPAVQMKGLGFARNSHQDLLAASQNDSTPATQPQSESAHHHGPGGHHGITPAVMERMEGNK